MSFSWANDLVKNTLKTAQRQIDSVLDIHDEEDEPEENIHLDETKSGSDDVTEHTDEVDDIPKPEDHESWQWEVPDETLVVVSEPNPVRDSHAHEEVPVYLDSPSSLSPTDESRFTQNSHSEEEVHPDANEQVPTADHEEDEVLRTDQNLDDAVTIASSDIEIIRTHDQWSTISSQVHVPSVSAPMLGEAARTLAGSSHDNDTAEQLLAIKSQHEHYCKKLDEMSRLNRSLKANNSSLKQQNKKLVERLTSSQQDKKDLQAKEVELKELMEEGQKLAAINGKQSTELKRLRQELSQMNVVTKARDSALMELQTACKKITVLEQELKETTEQLEAAENANAKVLLEMSQTQEDTDYAQRQYDELRDAISALETEVQKLKTDNAILERERNEISSNLEEEQRGRMKIQAELVIKADLVEGLSRDNEAYVAKINRMKENYTELECRLQKLMDSEREKMEHVANTHGPLLTRINELETQLQATRTSESTIKQKLKEVENSNQNITQMKEAYDSKLKEKYSEINKLSRDVESLKRRNRELIEEKMTAYKETLSQMNEHHAQITDLVEDMDNANTHIVDLTNELKKQVGQILEQKLKIDDLTVENRRLNSQITELSTASAEHSTRTESQVYIREATVTPVSNEERHSPSYPSFVDYSHSGIPNEISAIHSELRNMKSVYQQTMVHVEVNMMIGSRGSSSGKSGKREFTDATDLSNFLLQSISDPIWKEFALSEAKKLYFWGLCGKLFTLNKQEPIVPAWENVMRAFCYPRFDDVKVVIVGQDPYPNPSNAIGYSFAVPEENPFKAGSVVNMFKSIRTDYPGQWREDYSLVSWMKQGVLLLNIVLTTKAMVSAAHENIGWKEFTSNALRFLVKKKPNTVFLLMGTKAQALKPIAKHSVCCPHPSPLSAHLFKEHHPFADVNSVLRQLNVKPINWTGDARYDIGGVNGSAM